MKRPLIDTRLEFNEKKHKYYLKNRACNGDEQLGRTPRRKTELTPVTLFVKGFFPPFDEKKIAKGVAYSRRRSGVDPKCTMRKVIAEWKAIAAEGTSIHKQIEQFFNTFGNITEIDDRALKGLDKLAFAIEKDFNPWKRYPELRVYSESWKLAGTIDLLEIDEFGNFIIVDWKTNRTLRFVGNDIKDGPLKGLKECNFDQYQLQLSVYAAILEKEYGLTCKGLYVVHLTPECATVHPVSYRKDYVERMVESCQNKNQ